MCKCRSRCFGLFSLDYKRHFSLNFYSNLESTSESLSSTQTNFEAYDRRINTGNRILRRLRHKLQTDQVLTLIGMIFFLSCAFVVVWRRLPCRTSFFSLVFHLFTYCFRFLTTIFSDIRIRTDFSFDNSTIKTDI